MIELGQPLRWLATCGSTNEAASQWAGEDAPHGALIVAKRQSKGKGRQGRQWQSTSGDLMCSLILRPSSLAPNHAPPLTLLVGLALFRALQDLGVLCQIKWPNDIYLDGKKCAGILTEMSSSGQKVSKIIVGIGVNIKNKESLANVNGIALETKQSSIDKWHVLDGFLEHFGALWPLFQKEQSLATHAKIITEHLLRDKQTLRSGKSSTVVTPHSVLSNGALVYVDEGGQRHQATSGELEVEV